MNTSDKSALRTARYIAIVLLLGFTFACEKKESIFEGPHFVRFSYTDTTVRESYTQVIRIPVHNAGPQLSTPITINYVVGGSAREDIDYRILGRKGSVEIPANRSFGYIQLQLINNANNILESQDIVLNLVEVTPQSLRIGLGSGETGKTARFTILDDCILSGTYTGVNNNLRTAPSQSGIAITSTDCKVYTVTNWNLDIWAKLSDVDSANVFGFRAIKPSLQFEDTGDNSLVIPKQVKSELYAPYDTIQGSGSLNPLNGQVTLNVQYKLPVRTPDGDTVFSFVQTLTYTPENK